MAEIRTRPNVNTNMFDGVSTGDAGTGHRESNKPRFKMPLPGSIGEDLASGGKWDHLLAESTRNNPTRRVYRNKLKPDFDTQVATLSPLVEQAVYSYGYRGADKWNAAQLADFGDFVINTAQLLIELQCQINELAFVPTITRDDTTAGAPFARDTVNQYLNDIMTGLFDIPHVPALSVYIKDWYTWPMFFSTGIKNQRIWPLVLLPCVQTKTRANMETLIQTCVSESAGLVGSNPFGDFTVPISTAIKTQLPINVFSDYGMMYAALAPFNAENGGANTAHFTFQASASDVYYYHAPTGIPDGFGLAPMIYATGTRTNYGSAMAASAAGDTSLETAAFGDTSWSTVVNTVADEEILRHFFQWANNAKGGNDQQAWGLLPYMNGRLTNTIATSETGWDNLLVSHLSQRLVGGPFSPRNYRHTTEITEGDSKRLAKGSPRGGARAERSQRGKGRRGGRVSGKPERGPERDERAYSSPSKRKRKPRR